MSDLDRHRRKLTVQLKVGLPYGREKWHTQRTVAVRLGGPNPKQVFEKINRYLDEITEEESADG